MDNVIPFPNINNNPYEEHTVATVLRMCVIHTLGAGVIDQHGATHLLSVLDTIEALWDSMAE